MWSAFALEHQPVAVNREDVLAPKSSRIANLVDQDDTTFFRSAGSLRYMRFACDERTKNISEKADMKHYIVHPEYENVIDKAHEMPLGSAGSFKVTGKKIPRTLSIGDFLDASSCSRSMITPKQMLKRPKRRELNKTQSDKGFLRCSQQVNFYPRSVPTIRALSPILFKSRATISVILPLLKTCEIPSPRLIISLLREIATGKIRPAVHS
ncbi:hypothetical protein V1515DRAFT_588926 [Lipomyces mesembrius]